MELSFGKTQDLFDKGHFLIISQAAAQEVSSLTSLAPEIRVLIAHACVHTGRIQVATNLVQSVMLANASLSVLARLTLC